MVLKYRFHDSLLFEELFELTYYIKILKVNGVK